MSFVPCLVKFVIKTLFQTTQRQLALTAEVSFKTTRVVPFVETAEKVHHAANESSTRPYHFHCMI